MVYQELIGLLDLHTHKLLQTYLNILFTVKKTIHPQLLLYYILYYITLCIQLQTHSF